MDLVPTWARVIGGPGASDPLLRVGQEALQVLSDGPSTGEHLRSPGGKPPLMQLVIPCFNEEGALPVTLRAVAALLDDLAASGQVDPASSVLYVDDGSRDATWSLIERAAQEDARVHGLKLSRNCGHQHALLAGLMASRGADVVVSMDADLQDDPSAVLEMLQAYEAGSEIVYGVRRSREVDTLFKRNSARWYYRLLHWAGVEVVPDHADFRLMSRRALDALADFPESGLYLRGVIPLLGFRSSRVLYDRGARIAGETHYPLPKMLKLAANGLLSFSTMPLRIITALGLAVGLGAFCVLLWALWVWAFTSHALPGWASTLVPLTFFSGVQLIAIGVVGSYVARVHDETKRRPRYIVEKVL